MRYQIRICFKTSFWTLPKLTWPSQQEVPITQELSEGSASSAGSNLNKQMRDVCPGLIETLFLFLNDSYFSLSDRASSKQRFPLWRHPRGFPEGPGKFSQTAGGLLWVFGHHGPSSSGVQGRASLTKIKGAVSVHSLAQHGHQLGALEGSVASLETSPSQCRELSSKRWPLL